MARDIDKVIVCNRTALTAKYGQAGARAVAAAIKRMIAADKKRGLTAAVVWIDDTADMKSVKGAPVINAKDKRGAKAAVDAIATNLTPDYILLLDGPDVVPHIDLDNDMFGGDDRDPVVESDLPYASDAPFSAKVSGYLAVTRVVGRLPAAPGEADPAGIVGLIDAAIAHKPRPRADYEAYFGISAEVWDQSTALSIGAIFGAHSSLVLAPAASHPGINPRLGRLAHFINCHGGSAAPEFFGQRGQDFPVAMESSKLAPRIEKDAVVAAECCYGAELYNFTQMGIDPPICLSYLRNGAIGYLGSTTIAYGPADSNGEADLITQYFLQAVLNGASLGRALLQARQAFIQRQKMASPTNLKTLGQFILLGDPSVQPCTAPDVVKTAGIGALAGTSAPTGAKDAASQRKNRRIALAGNGVAVASTATRPGKRTAATRAVAGRIRALAAERGFTNKAFEMFAVHGGADFQAAAKAKGGAKAAQPRVAVLTELRSPKKKQKNAEVALSVHVLVTHMLGDGIVAIEECESR